MKTIDVLDRLDALHPRAHGEWAFTREFNQIDAYAVRLFSGTGRNNYRRLSYEVKVSWADFMNEVRKPDKRAGALAVSHQFYFAMPAELAARALATITLEMPECGVLAIHPEGHRPGEGERRWWCTAHCVGGAVRPDVHLLRRAPIRPCRDWSMGEVANLLRRQHGADVEVMRQERDRARQECTHRGSKLRRAREELARTREALDELAGHTVEEGTEWTGPLSDGGGRRKEARVVVVGVDRRYATLPPQVRVRRLSPAGEPMVGYPNGATHEVGEFLTLFTRCEVATVREVG